MSKTTSRISFLSFRVSPSSAALFTAALTICLLLALTGFAGAGQGTAILTEENVRHSRVREYLTRRDAERALAKALREAGET